MKSSNTSDSVSPKWKCGHLKSFETDAYVGSVNVAGVWTMSCMSCVAQSINESIRRRVSPAKIVKLLDFRCCNHRKKEGAGCRTCLAAVTKIVGSNWLRVELLARRYDLSELMRLLTKANKPEGSSRRIATQHAEVSAVEAHA